MTDRPILFSGPMIRALLSGTKTQTRRVLKPWPGYQSEWLTMDVLHRAPTCYLAVVDGDFGVQMQHPLAGQNVNGIENDSMSPLTWVRLPYAPGDRLWVRETWAAGACANDLAPRCLHPGFWLRDNGGLWYAADDAVPAHPVTPKGPNRPGLFMPRWASRLTLIVTDVRVQRLQEISGTDAVAEGVSSRLPDNGIAQQEYFDLWDRIHGQGVYHLNPWVCAVTFTVHRKNIDQMEAT